MIKKLLAVSLIFGTFISFSQNIELRIHNRTSLINGTTITVIDTLENDALQDVEVKIDAKSVYSSSKNIKVKKIEKTTTAPTSKNAICWFTCTAGEVWGNSPTIVSDPLAMPASQTTIFSGHVYPNLAHGNSTFRYVWFDDANPSDSTWVDVIFEVRNPNGVGINETKKETSLSLFPNPTSSILNVKLNSNEENKKVEIIDLLGKKIFTKSISNNNENFSINTSEFKPGIYFVSVSSNGKAIRTEKIVVAR